MAVGGADFEQSKMSDIVNHFVMHVVKSREWVRRLVYSCDKNKTYTTFLLSSVELNY